MITSPEQTIHEIDSLRAKLGGIHSAQLNYESSITFDGGEGSLEQLRDLEVQLSTVNRGVARIADNLVCTLFNYYRKLKSQETLLNNGDQKESFPKRETTHRAA